MFYLDPKIAVGTIIRSRERRRIVLVKRAIEPGYGKWVFPGGYVDRGEEITLAALREAREEAGLDVRLDHLINIYSYAGRAPVIIVYAATMMSGELAVDDEGLEAREFDLDEIPWDDLAFRSTREALRDYIDGQQDGAPSKIIHGLHGLHGWFAAHHATANPRRPSGPLRERETDHESFR